MKIAREGLPFIFIFLCVGFVFLFFKMLILTGLSILLFLGTLYFFRDPERRVIRDDRLILSPADGKVVETSMKEDDMMPGRRLQKVSIFLSLFNVHITRAPISGKILRVEYRPGRFLPAQKSLASEKNEQNSVLVCHEDQTLLLRLIAGLFARRIVFNKKENDCLEQGERIGMIRFGSRVDLLFDPALEVLVENGDRVKGGLSPIARKKET